MVLTPEETSRGSILAIFIILVLIITGAFFLVVKSLPISFGIALLVVSAMMVIFYSQEIGILSIFLFAVIAVAVALFTLNLERGFLIASLLVGAFVAYSLLK